MNRIAFVRASVGLTAGVALAVAVPLAASAHVRITPDQAVAGGEALVSFRVPTESATASTVKLEIDVPTNVALPDVTYEPVAGWTAKVVTGRLPKPIVVEGDTVTSAVTKIIWTADPGDGIKPGQFLLFPVLIDPVPDAGKVMFTAHQTYSNGTVVNWNEPTPATGDDEPDFPAPTLYIDDVPPAVDQAATGPTLESTPVGSPAGASGSGTSVVGSSVVSASATSAAGVSSTEVVALAIALGGLVLSAIALVVAVLALRLRRNGSR